MAPLQARQSLRPGEVDRPMGSSAPPGVVVPAKPPIVPKGRAASRISMRLLPRSRHAQPSTPSPGRPTGAASPRARLTTPSASGTSPPPGRPPASKATPTGSGLSPGRPTGAASPRAPPTTPSASGTSPPPGRPPASRPHRQGQVRRLVARRAQPRLGLRDKTVRLWDVASARETARLEGHTDFCPVRRLVARRAQPRLGLL